jgi:hypothetical protein
VSALLAASLLLLLLLLLLPLLPLVGVPAAVPSLVLLLLLLLLLLPKGSEASAATSVTGKEALRSAETCCVSELAALTLLLLLLALLVSLPLAYPLSEPLSVAVGGGVGGYEVLLLLLLAVVAFTRSSGELPCCCCCCCFPEASAERSAAAATGEHLFPRLAHSCGPVTKTATGEAGHVCLLHFHQQEGIGTSTSAGRYWSCNVPFLESLLHADGCMKNKGGLDGCMDAGRYHAGVL